MFPLLPSLPVSVLSAGPLPSAVVVLMWAWVSRPLSGQGRLRCAGSEDSDLHGRGQQPGACGAPPEGPGQLRGEIQCKDRDAGGGSRGATLLVSAERLRKARGWAFLQPPVIPQVERRLPGTLAPDLHSHAPPQGTLTPTATGPSEETAPCLLGLNKLSCVCWGLSAGGRGAGPRPVPGGGAAH